MQSALTNLSLGQVNIREAEGVAAGGEGVAAGGEGMRDANTPHTPYPC